MPLGDAPARTFGAKSLDPQPRDIFEVRWKAMASYSCPWARGTLEWRLGVAKDREGEKLQPAGCPAVTRLQLRQRQEEACDLVQPAPSIPKACNAKHRAGQLALRNSRWKNLRRTNLPLQVICHVQAECAVACFRCLHCSRTQAVKL